MVEKKLMDSPLISYLDWRWIVVNKKRIACFRSWPPNVEVPGCPRIESWDWLHSAISRNFLFWIVCWHSELCTFSRLFFFVFTLHTLAKTEIIYPKKCEGISSNTFYIRYLNIRHPGQLTKWKSWEPFWSYQLNSTANPAHLPHIWAKFEVNGLERQCYLAGTS